MFDLNHASVSIPQETDPEERVLSSVNVGILTILEEDDPAVSPNVRDWAVVLEGSIVLHDLPDLSTAFAYLFGLLYAINIDYPKGDEVHMKPFRLSFSSLALCSSPLCL